MGIEIKNTDKVIKLLNMKITEGMKQKFDQAIQDEMTRMQHNADGGRDVNGAPFVAYSPEYAKKRADAGYSTTPNLVITGQMRSAMTHEIKQEGNNLVARLFFRPGQTTYSGKRALGGSTRTVSIHDRVRWNNPTRRFFEITEDAVKRITKALGGR